MLTLIEKWSLGLQIVTLAIITFLAQAPVVEDQFVLTALLLWATAIALSAVCDWRELQRQDDPREWLTNHSLELLPLFLAPVLMLIHLEWMLLLVGRQLSMAFRLLHRSQWANDVLQYYVQRPAQLMAMSFVLLIGLGTTLLMLPGATTAPGSLHFLPALFTATSASCVTGLIVLDTPHAFTLLGQTIILLLIQIGGLGIMTLSSFILWMMGRKMGIQSRTAIGEILDESKPNNLFRLIRLIVLATVLTEFVGAIILFFSWYDGQRTVGYTAFLAVFHSVSAFCNAGFALWSDSLMSFRSDWVVNFTIMFLILAGSLGFPVLASLMPTTRQRTGVALKLPWYQRLKVYVARLSINTKVVLVAQPILILGAFFVFFGLEHGNLLKGMPLHEKILTSLFQSVTLRTAGFNTVDFAQLSHATLLMMLVWMFIGGCSAGTAGGVKVNTIAVLFLSLRSIMRGRNEVEVFGREIPHATIRRATVIFFTFISLLLMGCFALFIVQPKLPFLRVLFEATSALGTVGLTVNTTGLLNPWGQFIIIVLMFIGRIGPLTVALAIGQRDSSGTYRYPRGRIQVG